MRLDLPHILIVDDDKRILQLINDYLIKNNFRISTADNALKAREKIENIEFDLIILDIMMPGESGLKLTDTLKKNNFKTEVTLAGRKINDGMVNYITTELNHFLNKKNKSLKNSKIMIIGLTYKAGVADMRNSLNFKIFKKI